METFTISKSLENLVRHNEECDCNTCIGMRLQKFLMDTADKITKQIPGSIRAMKRNLNRVEVIENLFMNIPKGAL